MTLIVFEGNRMTAQGHAGAGTKGNDLVCAGLSTLFYAAGEMILEMEAAGKLREAPEVHLQPGNVALSAVPTEEAKERFRGAWEMLVDGCQLLAQTYPENIVMTVAGATE